VARSRILKDVYWKTRIQQLIHYLTRTQMRLLRLIDLMTSGSLGCGIAVPILYYGVQLASAPFFPDFSFLGTTASELGSDLSTRPWIFNAGAILTGIAAFTAAVGFLGALRSLRTNLILAWLVSIAIAITGLSSLWAGVFPMPDPRHGGHPSLLFAMLALPFVLALALWQLGASRPLKAYLIATMALLLVLFPFMSGMTGLDTHTYQGLLQRVFALTVFLPIGVGGYVLRRRVEEMQATVDIV
jgi:hypothetical membrane protein